jgi:hypothetical protein
MATMSGVARLVTRNYLNRIGAVDFEGSRTRDRTLGGHG